MNNNDVIAFPTEAIDQVKGSLFNLPRELSGRIMTSIRGSLDNFEGEDSSSFIDEWYRNAEVASYLSTEAAAAYLGAYGPRSILKYQEALFSLFVIRNAISKRIRILDFGSGPCVGFAAIVDMSCVIQECLGVPLSIEYRAVDRSDSMLTVGEDLCKRVSEKFNIESSYTLSLASTSQRFSANTLIVANVLNDGEGNLGDQQLLSILIQSVDDLEDIVLIEPATEHSSRQMCSLAKTLDSFQHIGPCPSGESECTEWSFRQFMKRIYPFEMRCLGRWAPAARTCKYSLALLSNICSPRVLPTNTYIVVGQRSSSGSALTCRLGKKQLMKIAPNGAPWDIVRQNGQIERWWP